MPPAARCVGTLGCDTKPSLGEDITAGLGPVTAPIGEYGTRRLEDNDDEEEGLCASAPAVAAGPKDEPGDASGGIDTDRRRGGRVSSEEDEKDDACRLQKLPGAAAVVAGA